jgi:VWFA-related protein
MKLHRFAAAVVWMLLSSWSLHAQQAEPPVTETSTPVIKTETRLVLVDTVVTDKKGAYISDLKQGDFKVWEDNKEQPIKTFSFENDASGVGDRRRYLVLFFDNSTMTINDQAKARDAALKFLDANAGANRYIAIVDFGGALHITQNFTSDAERLKQVVRTIKFSAVSPNVESASAPPMLTASTGIPQLTDAAADYGVRTMLLALRNMAKGVANVPGRKTLVLFSAGFPLDPADPSTPERQSELTAAIDSCNKANVAVYPIDVRGLVTPMSAAPRLQIFPDTPGRLITATLNLDPAGGDGGDDAPARLVYVQHGGGTGGGGGGGGHSGGTGGAGGSGHGGTGTGNGGTHGSGGTGTRGAGGSTTTNPLPVAPYSQSRAITPTSDATGNQQVLYELAAGTGGFVIVNSNDLLGGLEKIAQEQNQYYVLGYTPPASQEGTCHTLRVKLDRSNSIVRSRSGYCNIRPSDLLAGKPMEKQLENQASGSQAGTVAASMRAPYFYTSPNTARVNLAIEIPSNAVKFEKVKGKQHAELNVLGLAYKPDGSVAARFSDKAEFDFDSKQELEEFYNKPYHYENQFEIGAGHYNLKVVFNSGGEGFGKLQIPLVVDNYDGKQFSMSAVALSKELHPLNQTASSLDAALLEDHIPLVAQGLQIVPTGFDRFKKTDLVTFYVEIYDSLLAGSSPPQVGIQMLVLDRKTGEKKVNTGGPAPSAKAGDPVVALGLKLPVDQLPPGSYQLEVRGTDSAGNFTRVRTADFEVE